ncbi:MAG: MarR family transcriptional regulator [bacterium]|nr:MarR family transcriptional regulator [bacterium]
MRLRQKYLSALKREIEKVGAEGITPSITRLLLPLEDEGELTVKELASSAGLNKSTTTILVNEMREIGLVEKIGDASDMRIVRVSLTEKGRAETSKIKRAIAEISACALDGVTPDEQANIKMGLFKIISNLSKG